LGNADRLFVDTLIRVTEIRGSIRLPWWVRKKEVSGKKKHGQPSMFYPQWWLTGI
jgi:hypothetical protein